MKLITPRNLILRSLITVTAVMLPLGSAFAARFEGRQQPIDLYSDAQRSDTLNGCSHLFPSDEPVQLGRYGPEISGLCSDTFASVYSPLTKTPVFVVEKLNSSGLAAGKGLKRSEVFFADPRLKASNRADLKDFQRSGYDRGHLSSAANSSSTNGMAQSFALSNMVAQAAGGNRGPWLKLEQDTRKYVERASGDVFVYSGPLFLGDNIKTIGKGKVWVPSHLFKAVYHPRTGKAWVHVLANTDDAQIEKPISYQEFTRKYNLQFIPELDGTGRQRARPQSYGTD